MNNINDMANMANMAIEKMTYKLVVNCTCDIFPEQYDIICDNNIIGSIRYRYGHLSCHAYTPFRSIPVFEWTNHDSDGYDGTIPTNHRKTLIQLCKTAIASYHIQSIFNV